MNNDGGPAFPSTTHTAEGHAVNGPEFGMTLRDYFAAKAMSIAHESEGGTIGDAEKELGLKSGGYRFAIHYPMLLAKRAYAFADAMLSARGQ